MFINIYYIKYIIICKNAKILPRNWSFEFWWGTYKDMLDILDDYESSSDCFFLVMKIKLLAIFCVSRKRKDDCFVLKCPRKRKPSLEENIWKPQSRRGYIIITKQIYIKIVAIIPQKGLFKKNCYFLNCVRYYYIFCICSWFRVKFSIEIWILFFRKKKKILN